MAITNENGGLTGSDALSIMNATGGNRGGSNGFGNMLEME